MNVTYGIIAIAVMALVTYLPRVLPVTVFRRKIRSRYIRSFLDYTPYAILGALTFPDIFYATGNTCSAIAGTGVALILAYFKRGLVEVALAAIMVAFIVELLI